VEGGRKGLTTSPYEDPDSFFRRRHGVDENLTIHCPLTNESEQGFIDGLGRKKNKHGDPFN
jgi:hypothetical protein